VPRLLRLAGAVAAVAGALASCGGDDNAEVAVPRADLVAPALAAVDAAAAAAGGEAPLLEIAATLESVDVIVQDEPGHGVLYRFVADELSGPIEPRDDPRPVFSSSDVALDPDRIFDGILAELPDAVILDLALRKEGDAVVIDATVASEQGGVLLVLLSPEGTILGTQAA
jgi:hypothetical protein